MDCLPRMYLVFIISPGYPDDPDHLVSMADLQLHQIVFTRRLDQVLEKRRGYCSAQTPACVGRSPRPSRTVRRPRASAALRSSRHRLSYPPSTILMDKRDACLSISMEYVASSYADGARACCVAARPHPSSCTPRFPPMFPYGADRVAAEDGWWWLHAPRPLCGCSWILLGSTGAERCGSKKPSEWTTAEGNVRAMWQWPAGCSRLSKNVFPSEDASWGEPSRTAKEELKL